MYLLLIKSGVDILFGQIWSISIFFNLIIDIR